MPKQPQYNTIVREAFSDYLDHNIDLNNLIMRLRDIELQVMSDNEEEDEIKKGLWFRFFTGDTMETTISEIEEELSHTDHPIATILKRGIAFGLESGELEVHFS